MFQELITKKCKSLIGDMKTINDIFFILTPMFCLHASFKLYDQVWEKKNRVQEPVWEEIEIGNLGRLSWLKLTELSFGKEGTIKKNKSRNTHSVSIDIFWVWNYASVESNSKRPGGKKK